MPKRTAKQAALPEQPERKELFLDKHQVDALAAIETAFLDYDRCLVKMFCGTGKSRIALKKIIDADFAVIVMPTIALITQFNDSYLTEYAHLLQGKALLSICSRDELKDQTIQYTTDVEDVVEFLAGLRAFHCGRLRGYLYL